MQKPLKVYINQGNNFSYCAFRCPRQAWTRADCLRSRTPQNFPYPADITVFLIWMSSVPFLTVHFLVQRRTVHGDSPLHSTILALESELHKIEQAKMSVSQTDAQFTIF